MSQMPLPPSDNPFSAPSSGPRELMARSLELKRVGVLSLGKILGSLYVCLGLLVGGVLTFASLLGAAAGGDNAMAGVFVGAASIIIIPIFYGVIGFVGGILMAAIYNVLASLIGGIEVEFK